MFLTTQLKLMQLALISSWQRFLLRTLKSSVSPKLQLLNKTNLRPFTLLVIDGKSPRRSVRERKKKRERKLRQKKLLKKLE